MSHRDEIGNIVYLRMFVLFGSSFVATDRLLLISVIDQAVTLDESRDECGTEVR